MSEHGDNSELGEGAIRVRRVIWPEPSTRTVYWSNWRTSMTTCLVPLGVGQSDSGSVCDYLLQG